MGVSTRLFEDGYAGQGLSLRKVLMKVTYVQARSGMYIDQVDTYLGTEQTDSMEMC